MAQKDQMTSVDDIAQDDRKLEEKATEMVRGHPAPDSGALANGVQSGVDVVLDTKETVGEDFGTVESAVCAILIKKHSAAGAVRVFGHTVINVVTGPTEGTGFVLVIRKAGEDCRLFGHPSLRYFYRRNT